jgi:ribosome biogenesis protein Nip4
MMAVKVIRDFALQFGVTLVLDEEMIVQREGRFFLLNNNIRPFASDDFFYAGTFLGKVRGGNFVPSFNLLSILAKYDVANRIVVDRKAAWLFICGRDLFKKSILHTFGKIHQNTHVLVFNQFGECLGYGRVLSEWKHHSSNKNEHVIVNVLDVGDFLRRERWTI